MPASNATGRTSSATTITVPRQFIQDLRSQIAEAHLALDGLAILLRRSHDGVEHGTGLLLNFVVERLEKCDSELTEHALGG